MYTLTARNAHQALPRALNLLLEVGVQRPSRNGDVLQSPRPVATTYERPAERVIYWPKRDANPFFHFLESLWMLAGRNDLAPLTKIVPRMAAYSDDGGRTQPGAYGWRWRAYFEHQADSGPVDQLAVIAHMLRENPQDRRAVLQMWDAQNDLGKRSADVPCNVTATVQVGADERLDLVVFCRSNDVVWGTYGANAVHFSVLHEYLARAVGREQGTYTQVSVNWHGYLATLEPLLRHDEALGAQVADLGEHEDPYLFGARPYPLMTVGQNVWDVECAAFVRRWASDDVLLAGAYADPFFGKVAVPIMRAHRAWITSVRDRAYDAALFEIARCEAHDWRIACTEWLERREHRRRRAADDGVHAASEAS